MLFGGSFTIAAIDSILIRYKNVVSSQVVLKTFFEMSLGGRDDDLFLSESLNSLDHGPVGLIEAAWRIAGG